MPGLISSLPGTAGLRPFISFSTSYPELRNFGALQKLRDSLGSIYRSFRRYRVSRALPEFFRGWAESAFCRDDADRKWLRLRSEVQKLYSVSETVTKIYRDGNAGPRFDGRHDAGHAVMFLDDARFLFHLRKGDRE